jgi:outer membrane protein TolC
MIMPMVTVTIPIYRKKYSAMKREAEFMLDATKEKHLMTSNNLYTNLQNALLDLHDAERRIDQYKWQANLTHQSLDILLTGFKTAGIDFEEVLRMQQKLLEIEFNLTESVVNYNTAAANIEYLVSKEIVNEDYQNAINK